MDVDGWAQVIREAAKSQEGLFALMILLVSSLALAFFRRSSDVIRLIVFVLMLVGVSLFGFAVARVPQHSEHATSRITGYWVPADEVGIYRGYVEITGIDLESDGSALQGTVDAVDGPERNSFGIRDGKVLGDRMSFTIQRNKELGRFDGKLDENTLYLQFSDDLPGSYRTHSFKRRR